MESSALLLGDSLSEWSHADHTSGMPHASSRTASSGTSTTPSVTTASTEWVASSAESDPEGSNALAPRHDRTIAQIGWAIYGIGSKSVSAVVFMVRGPSRHGPDHSLPSTPTPTPPHPTPTHPPSPAPPAQIAPLLLIDTARREREAAPPDSPPPLLQPTGIFSWTISAGLLLQCVAAPVLAAIADLYGLRRSLQSAHILLGSVCLVGLACLSPDAPLLVQAALVALVYYASALAWMMQNALLPSVASAPRRPALSLASAALCDLGGAAFLVLQLRVLEDGVGVFDGTRGEPPATLRNTLRHAFDHALGYEFQGLDTLFADPLESLANPDGALQYGPNPSHRALSDRPLAGIHSWRLPHAMPDPTRETLSIICWLAAASWLASAIPAMLCLATLRPERRAGTDGPRPGGPHEERAGATDAGGGPPPRRAGQGETQRLAGVRVYLPYLLGK